MTNKEVLKLLADKEPILLAELLDDIYCIGCNDGSRATVEDIHYFTESVPEFNEEWLNSEYDKDLIRESDVDRLTKGEN